LWEGISDDIQQRAWTAFRLKHTNNEAVIFAVPNNRCSVGILRSTEAGKGAQVHPTEALTSAHSLDVTQGHVQLKPIKPFLVRSFVCLKGALQKRGKPFLAATDGLRAALGFVWIN
jgi:hypothetical protein